MVQSISSWAALISFFTHIDNASSNSSPQLPLSRSLGYTHFLHENEAKLSQEYLELYHDVMKASRVSQESSEEFDEQEREKLEKIVGIEKLEIMKKGLRDRRGSTVRVTSPLRARRTSSQASRRQRLYDQSLRSHRHHARASVQPASQQQYETNENE